MYQDKDTERMRWNTRDLHNVLAMTSWLWFFLIPDLTIIKSESSADERPGMTHRQFNAKLLSKDLRTNMDTILRATQSEPTFGFPEYHNIYVQNPKLDMKSGYGTSPPKRPVRYCPPPQPFAPLDPVVRS